MADTSHALDFLTRAKHEPVHGLCVLFGDEAFLKRKVRDLLIAVNLGDDDAQMSVSTWAGDQASWRDVMDDLGTRSLFGGGPRMVIVENGDDFVSEHRAALEDLVAKGNVQGLLVLDVTTFPSNTRLAKAVAASGLSLECKAPTAAKTLKWLQSWAKKQHDATLDSTAAELLVELIGPEPGLLDQELAKLSAARKADEPITASAVEELVGGWRIKTTWEMLDAAASGDASSALVQLDELLISGENPVGLLAQIASTLRRFSTATRLIEQAELTGRRIPLRDALTEAGFKPFVIGRAEPQLKQIGRHRGAALADWLIEADLGLKGASSQRPRAILEQLIVRLSKQAAVRV